MPAPLRFLPADVAPGEPPAKVRAAIARFALEDATDRAAFDLGYTLLDAEFGAANELERREVLTRWFAEGSLSPAADPIRAHYHLLLARDADGRVAAVRDLFVVLPAAPTSRPRIVVLMSHSLVFSERRRTGVAALLRAAPVAVARRYASDAEVTLVAEMEPAEPDRPETTIRLVSYGRAGFRVVPPDRLPYAQPDFRDVDRLGIAPLPLPFLLLVRQVGDEDHTTLAADRAIAVVDHLDAVHRPSTGEAQLLAIRAHALQNVAPDGPPLPLGALPATPDDHARLAPLLRARLLPLYPPAWRSTPGAPP